MPWSSLSPLGTQPPLGPAEMDLLVSRTGLTLNPGQMADLVLAWRQLAVLIAAIPASTALADNQAFVFKLPGPPSEPAPAAGKIKAAAARRGGKKPMAGRTPPRKSGQPARER